MIEQAGPRARNERANATWLELRESVAVRRTLWIVLLALAMVVPLAVRVSWEGRAELEAADQAREQAQVEREILHLGRAARWRLPLADHHQQALERLLELGDEHELRGDDGVQIALSAYREARGAILATRSLGVPDPELFQELNWRIARLMAAQERAFGIDLSGTGEQEAWHYALLEQVPGPDAHMGTAMAIAFVSWVAATVGFMLRAIDARGHVRARAAIHWGGASLVLLVAWMVLLRYADG